jgi:hypothetical protein
MRKSEISAAAGPVVTRQLVPTGIFDLNIWYLLIGSKEHGPRFPRYPKRRSEIPKMRSEIVMMDVRGVLANMYKGGRCGRCSGKKPPHPLANPKHSKEVYVSLIKGVSKHTPVCTILALFKQN